MACRLVRFAASYAYFLLWQTFPTPNKSRLVFVLPQVRPPVTHRRLRRCRGPLLSLGSSLAI